MFKHWGAIGAASLLTACGAPRPQHDLSHGAPAAATPTAPGAAVAEPAPGPGVFAIGPESDIRLLVYRAGTMARLGHNHVIVNRHISGWVTFAGDPAAAAFALRVPVEDFIVDDARMRADAGSDFADGVPDDAKSGTRRNMLSEALLDGGRFPYVTLTSIAVAPAAATSPGMMRVTLALSVAGHESTLVVPVTFDAGGRLSADGSVELRQSALGLTPFSIMLGALQVQDEFTVKFHVVALPSQPAAG